MAGINEASKNVKDKVYRFFIIIGFKGLLSGIILPHHPILCY